MGSHGAGFDGIGCGWLFLFFATSQIIVLREGEVLLFRIDEIGVFIAGEFRGGEANLAGGIPVGDVCEVGEGDAGVRPTVAADGVPLRIRILAGDVGAVFRRRHVDGVIFVVEIDA